MVNVSVTDRIDRLRGMIDQVMRRDRYDLQRRLKSIRQGSRRRSAADQASRLDRLEKQISRSIEHRRRRAGQLPRPVYAGELPFRDNVDEIAEAIRAHQVVVVCGETGCGKSTQLPQVCLQLGLGVAGYIGHTQPRRIAARSVASYIADQLKTPLGGNVAYKVRFADTTGPRTYIKLMTDGILLAEIPSDRYLDQYDAIIIDEAHERSLNIDFLLGYLKRLLPKRPDLKVIVTSATIDPGKFSDFFSDRSGRPAPVIEVKGRTYPVDVWYREPALSDKSEEPDVIRSVVSAVEDLQSHAPGDTLVFMPTERDINEAAHALRSRYESTSSSQHGIEVLPLYARLSLKEQSRIFQSHTTRRIVIATNVAESSITVPGIRYVVDTGTSRISRYSARANIQRLPIEPVSQASAEQRKGRCGRVSEGICVRLYSERDFQNRDRYTPPEIMRTDLASVILQMKSMHLGEIARFPFIDPPPTGMIQDGYRTLFELGAVDHEGRLTEIGRKLSALPVHPRIGRIILAGHQENCLNEILIIASAMEVYDPRLRPEDKQQQADELHARFMTPDSDFMGYLKLWDFIHQLKSKLSRRKLQVGCRQNFLSYKRVIEWLDIHRQLRDLAESCGMVQRGRSDTFSAIHRALLTGLLSKIAFKSDTYEYTGAGGKKLYLWPGSSLFDKQPKWIMAAEHVETTRRYARMASRISPGWIEPLAGHVVQRSYSQPHWNPETAHVQAYEKVSLFGMTIMPRRRVHYGPVDPVKSRAIFIHHALVQGEYITDAPFFEHNRQLIEEVETLEAKARRRDLLADLKQRYDFYDRRIPAGIHNGPAFEKWRRKAEHHEPMLLFMNKSHLLVQSADDVTPEQYPDQIRSGEMTLPLAYRFDPAAGDDGITVTVPVTGLNKLEPDRLEWLVPGRLQEKVMELIRSLPKSYRRSFVPAPDYAKQVVAMIGQAGGSLVHAVADSLLTLTGVEVPVDQFRAGALPPFLRMNVRLMDDEGRHLAEGRDIGLLRSHLSSEATAGFIRNVDERWIRDGITGWDFETLPKSLDVDHGGIPMKGYPGLMDDESGRCVCLRVFDSEDLAGNHHRRGLRRLAELQLSREIRYQITHHTQWDHAAVLFSPMDTPDRLVDNLSLLVAELACFEDVDDVRDRDRFVMMLDRGWNRIREVADRAVSLADQILSLHQQVMVAITSPGLHESLLWCVDDIRLQVGQLVHRDFLIDVPWDWLRQYPRYLYAALVRLEKVREWGTERDAHLSSDVRRFWNRYIDRYASNISQGIFDKELGRFRWMIEEYRVSLFAQKLGTSVPVSEKRLEKQWQKVGRI